MMTDLPKLIRLFRLSFLGRLSSEEKAGLERIVSEDGNFAELDERLHDNGYMMRKLREYDGYDDRRAFRRFRRATLGRMLRRRWPSVAAAAASLAIVAGSLFYMADSQERKTAMQTLEKARDFLPGNKKAQLKLANGQVIDIADTAIKVSVEGIGSLTSENGNVVYSSDEKSPEASALAMNELSVPRGGECTFTLDDGTKVWLNAGSKLEYPVRFTGKERRVKVSGEVFFKVTHDERHPFVVETPKMSVTVLGTTFNVRDFADEKTAAATLIAGSVSVGNAGHHVVLSPGYQASSEGGSAALGVRKVDVNAVAAWTENKFVFWQQGFDEILASVARWYDIEVVYKNIDPQAYSLTGKIPRDCTLADVIELLEMITDARFTLEGKVLTVTRK